MIPTEYTARDRVALLEAQQEIKRKLQAAEEAKAAQAPPYTPAPYTPPQPSGYLRQLIESGAPPVSTPAPYRPPQPSGTLKELLTRDEGLGQFIGQNRETWENLPDYRKQQIESEMAGSPYVNRPSFDLPPMPSENDPEELQREQLNLRLQGITSPSLASVISAIGKVPPVRWWNENAVQPFGGMVITAAESGGSAGRAERMVTGERVAADEPHGMNYYSNVYQKAPIYEQIPAAIAGDPLVWGPQALGVAGPALSGLTKMAEESQFARQAVAAGKEAAVGGETGWLKFGKKAEMVAKAAEEAPKGAPTVATWRKTLAETLAPVTDKQKAWIRAAAQAAHRTEGDDVLKTAVGKLTYWIRGQTGERSLYEAAQHVENVSRAKLLKANAARTDLSNAEKLLEAKRIESGPVAPDFRVATPLSLTPEEADAIQTAINASDKLKPFEGPRLLRGLDQYLVGSRPALASDVGLFGRVFGKPALDAMAGTSLASKFGGVALDVFLLPKTAEATADMSYILRQGGVLIRHVKQFVPAIRQYARAIIDPEVAALESERQLANPIIQKWGRNLALTQAGEGAARTEEAYVGSSILRPGLTVTRDQAVVERLGRAFLWIPAQIVNRSEAGAVAFMDKLRGDVFVDRILTMERRGTVIDQNLADDVAEWINLTTGRARLPGLEGENTVKLLNNIMFSPRFRASRVMLGPEAIRLAIKNPAMRREIASDLAVWVSSNMTMLMLAKGSGFADVELDPRSTDFMKYKIGHQRYDPWSGVQPLVRTAAQMFSGTIKTPAGDKYPADRLVVLGRYILSSLAPSPQVVMDVARGKTTLGQKVQPISDPKGFVKYVGSKFVPLLAQDFLDAWRIEGKRAATGSAVYSFLGGGSLTYETAYDNLADAKDKVAQANTNPKTKQPYKNFEEMKNVLGTPLANEAVTQDEGVIAAQAAVEEYQTNRGGSVSMTSVAAPFVAEQATDDAAFKAGTLSPTTWLASYKTRQQNLASEYAGYLKGNPELAAKLDETAKNLDPFKLPADASPDIVRAAYFKLFDPYRGGTGLITAEEWMKLGPELDRFTAQLTPEQAKSLEENQLAGKSETVKQYKADQKVLQPYWDMQDKNWKAFAQKIPKLQKYANASYDEFLKVLGDQYAAKGQSRDMVETNGYVKAFDSYAGDLLYAYLIKNPEVDALRNIWGYTSGVHSIPAGKIYQFGNDHIKGTGLEPRLIGPS